MTEMQTTPVRPTPRFDQADRLRKALREADLGVEEMADYLEVSRNTVGSWINGHTKPRATDVRVFAARTGVAYEWLAYGREPDDDELVRHQGLEPRTRWLRSSTNHDHPRSWNDHGWPEHAPSADEILSMRKQLGAELRARENVAESSRWSDLAHELRDTFTLRNESAPLLQSSFMSPFSGSDHP